MITSGDVDCMNGHTCPLVPSWYAVWKSCGIFRGWGLRAEIRSLGWERIQLELGHEILASQLPEA